MLGVLWLAVSLLAQFTAPISQTAAEVIWLAGEHPTPIRAALAEPSSHNTRIIFIVVSRDTLSLSGERAPLRVNDPRPSFQLTLPGGIDADDVLLLRLKSKDGRRSVAHTGSRDHPFNKDAVVPITLSATDPATPRTYRVQTTSPLSPGEYAFLIDMRFYQFGVD